MTLLSINCGHFGFELHIQCPFVYTTDALHKSDTQLGGNQRWNYLSVTVFRPFLTWKKRDPVLHVVVFFFFVLFFVFHLLPPFSLNEDQMLLSQASSDLRLIFSPLLMNAKITHHVTWRRESCIALSINFSHSKRSLYASTATWGNAMYVFWLIKEAKSQGKPFSLEDNKKCFWMEMN